MDADDPDARIPQLRLIYEQIQSQLGSYESRLAAMDSRSGVLVGAAAISSGLIATTGSSLWILLAVAAGLLSVIGAAVALAPRYGKSIKAARLVSDVYPLSEGRALLWLIDAHIELLALNEPKIVFKARMLQVSFFLFAASILLFVVAIFAKS